MENINVCSYCNEEEALLAAIFSNLVATFVLILLFKQPTPRAPSLTQQRLHWDTFQRKHSQRKDFKRHIRLPSIEAFNKLLGYVRQDLVVNE